ncbi:MAG: HAD-IB family hydrolase [Alphaproteobacteria bacterium]|nr:HAD-IB family hydrolase [Alphaproteobacteria bacterium]MBU1525144.1 HAD-IB family hydrolase [Alphaproteobacteria bacterium]MBU2350952.1 HAD-IB family hydrolase [Alphaproteobacteria bacterium]MBU2383475.1 HAD-IB family hydrolase [Alphaproteobacteria bacterium]
MSDMGSQQGTRQSGDGRAVVAFDFDGTLTVRDSFTSFLRARGGKRGWAKGLVRLSPAIAAYARDRDRGRLKAASVREFLLGLPRETLEAEAETFAARVWDAFMRPDALRTWEDWGRRGALRVIVTASPETTVAPFARRLDAELLLGTPLAFDGEDRVAGAFAGPNCRGEEKVRRLRAVFGDDLRLTAAYGDTSGDREMLRIAEEPGFRVFTGRP